MKILCADSFPESHAEILRSRGYSITAEPSLDENTLAEAITDHDILIVRSTKVTAQTLDKGSALKLVIRAGAGTNTIDKAHAASRDIAVCNVPGANALAVAELVMGLILAIDRHIADNVADLRNGTWNKKKYSVARGLCGQSLGILGLGAIGFAVAERARAFGINVFALSKSGRSAAALDRIAEAGIELLDGQEELLGRCDIVSLHVPATEETRNMVNAEFLGAMPEGAVLINTSRGEVVDEQALIAAMDSRGIRAGLDVYQDEPGAGDNSFTSALASHPNVVGTHHIGASTEQAQTAVSDGVIAVIESFENGTLINKVN